MLAQINETLPYLTALAAAVAGSLHCAGMCGPLRLICNDVRGARWKYQVGRGLAYGLLGAMAGGLGFILPLWALLLLLLAAFSGAVFKMPTPPAWISLRKILLKLGSTSPFLMGLSSGLLPCGLLHGWLAAAAATGKPLQGGILLFLLWAGSLPALEASSLLLGAPLRKLNQRFPRSLKISLLGVALLPLIFRFPFSAAPVPPNPEPHCHSAEMPSVTLIAPAESPLKRLP